MALKFADEVSLSYFAGFLTCRKILRHGADGFTSPPKEVVLRIFIILKNSSSSHGFEHENLASNKHYNNNLLISGMCHILLFESDTEL
jgi:hypothetical protein